MRTLVLTCKNAGLPFSLVKFPIWQTRLYSEFVEVIMDFNERDFIFLGSIVVNDNSNLWDYL